MKNDTQLANQLCTSIEKSLLLLRSLKSIVWNAHNALADKMIKIMEPEASSNITDITMDLRKFGEQMTSEYEKLETEAKSLPKQTPNSLMVNKLNQFLLDCATNPQMKDTYACIRNALDWSDSTASYINYACELFKISQMVQLTQQRHRKLTLAHQWNAINEPQTSIGILAEPSSFLQRKFENDFNEFMKHRILKVAISTDQQFDCMTLYNFVERSALSCVYEIKYIAKLNGRSSDGQLVCVQKFLMLVNNAVIECIHYIAPHEDWNYDEIPGFSKKKTIDLNSQSRFELYQKLNIYGNMILNTLHATLPIWNWWRLGTPLFQQLSRLIVINQPCCKCKKRLKDFFPVIENYTKPLSHLTCK